MKNIFETRNEYIDKYFENSKLVDLDDFVENEQVINVPYEDLPKTNLRGYFPFASRYVDKNGKRTTPDNKNAKLVFSFLKNFHEIYVGTTGSGKTTGCVIPQLRAISSIKDKPNLFLTDPKGELFEKNAKHLEKMGYQIFLLNFKDANKSNRWNPFHEIFLDFQNLKNLGKNYLYLRTPVLPEYQLFDDIDSYKHSYIAYDGYAFSTLEQFDTYLSFQTDSVRLAAEDKITQIANMIIPLRNTRDPSWEEGANRILRGLIYALLEDSLLPNSELTIDMMTLKTIKELYNVMRSSMTNTHTGSGYDLTNHRPFKHKTHQDYSMQLIRPILDNASGTTRSYLGVFETAIQKWLDFKIISLTTGHDIDLSNNIKKPFAIFLVTRDYEKSDFLVAGLFIDWVYRQMVQCSENFPETYRETHFILDEFGNIPQIKEFENKIATSRSRSIWFHLVIQSYAQLKHVYDDGNFSNSSEIIKDNCNSQVFLGAQHYGTKESFSQECGEHTILSLNSLLKNEENNFIKTRLIPVSKLNDIKPGEMYIKRISMPVIKSSFVRSYACKEFLDDYKDGFSIIPNRTISFGAARFTYNLIKPKRKNSSKR